MIEKEKRRLTRKAQLFRERAEIYTESGDFQ